MGCLGTIFSKYHMQKDPVTYLRKQGARIGDGCSIASNVSFGSEPYLINIGDNVRLTERVRLITHDGGVWVVRHIMDEFKDVDLFGKITIGNNVHVGVDSVIMPGVTIGNNVVIGCCAVVTHDIPDNSVAAGTPARVIESIDEYIEKNKSEYTYTKHMTPNEKRKFIEENMK